MRKHVTDGLEILGGLLLAAGLALYVSTWSVPGGLGAAAVLLIVESAVLERVSK